VSHRHQEVALVDDAGAAGGGAEHGPAGRGAVVGGHITLVVDHDSSGGEDGGAADLPGHG